MSRRTARNLSDVKDKSMNPNLPIAAPEPDMKLFTILENVNKNLESILKSQVIVDRRLKDMELRISAMTPAGIPHKHSETQRRPLLYPDLNLPTAPRF